MTSSHRSCHSWLYLLLTLTTISLPTPEPLSAQDTTSVLLQRRVYSVVSTRDGERELVMDLYRPVGGPPRGAVVVMHGGGFTESYVDIGENKIYGQVLAQRGYLAAAIAYRSVEDAPPPNGWAREYVRMVRELGDPRLEAAMDEFGQEYADAVGAGAVDLLSAVRWLRSRAGELGFDPEQLAIFGASSGSISAMTTAYALELYGAKELNVAGVIDLRGLLLRAASAENPFDPDEPPLLMLHGERDRGFPLPEVEAFFRLAREGGTPVQFYTSPGHGHELGGRELLGLRIEGGVTVLDHIDAFLQSAFARRGLPAGPVRGRLVPRGSR